MTKTAQHVAIPGITYIDDYLDYDQRHQLRDVVEAADWITAMNHRIQQYGWRYLVTNRPYTPADRLGDLPEWAFRLAQRLADDGHIDAAPNQLIVEECLPGHATAPLSTGPGGEDTLCYLSLGSQAMMEFTDLTSAETTPILLEPGSLLVIPGDMREDWLHRIPGRTADHLGDLTYIRGRRIALTFRFIDAS